MMLTPEETKNSELLRNLAQQQALQQQQALRQQQARRYSHGWHDMRNLYATVKEEVTEVVDKEVKFKEPIELPKPKLYQVFVLIAVMLLIFSLILKVIL